MGANGGLGRTAAQLDRRGGTTRTDRRSAKKVDGPFSQPVPEFPPNKNGFCRLQSSWVGLPAHQNWTTKLTHCLEQTKLSDAGHTKRVPVLPHSANSSEDRFRPNGVTGRHRWR